MDVQYGWVSLCIGVVSNEPDNPTIAVAKLNTFN